MLVPPMSLPDGDDDTTVQHVLNSDAVWLLGERAAAVVPGFTVDKANAAAVQELCRRLDGIPLALELAAVRLGSLSLDQLNQGLATELSILGSGNRGAESRQQTLEATIGWSYRLLDEQERLLLARLSVFAGGFNAEAAIAVCCDARLPAGRLVDLLGALVEKSILNRDLNDLDPRYGLLETIRQSLRIGTLLKDVEVVGWSLIYVTIARWFAGDLAEATRAIASRQRRLVVANEWRISDANPSCARQATPR
jgi:predicted ATPase